MPRRTQAQLDQTRAALLGAAEELFAQRGFAHTQIVEIADAAGVGISSFYRQFEDKEALLGTLIAELFERLRRELVETRSGVEQQSPLDQVLTIQRTYDALFRVLAEQSDLGKIMLRSGYGVAPHLDQLIWDGVDGLVQDIVADLGRAEQQGILRLEGKQHFGDAMIGMVIQLAHRMLFDGTPSAQQAADFCTRLSLGSLLAFMPQELAVQYLPLIGRHGPTRLDAQDPAKLS